MSSKVECSVVVPIYNEEENIPELYRRLTAVLAETGSSYEIVFVSDGSTDDSETLLAELFEADDRVVLVTLSRNYGHQICITAGMEHAVGEAVIVIDADLQDPPEVIPEMLAYWREGYDVVYGVRRSRSGESLFKRATAALFYRALRRLTAIDLPLDAGDFRLLSRRVVDALGRMPERHRFVRGLVASIGYRQIGVTFERAPRFAGGTKYPLHKMMRLAADAVVSFSTAPLRAATTLGFVVSVLSFLYMPIAVYVRLRTGDWLPGWASLMVVVLFLGGVQLICLGIIGEYVGRASEETKRRPLYFVDRYDHHRGPS